MSQLYNLSIELVGPGEEVWGMAIYTSHVEA